VCASSASTGPRGVQRVTAVPTATGSVDRCALKPKSQGFTLCQPTWHPIPDTSPLPGRARRPIAVGWTRGEHRAASLHPTALAAIQRALHHHKAPGGDTRSSPIAPSRASRKERPCGVSSARRGQWRGVGQVAFAHACRGNELGSFAVAERDRRGAPITTSKVRRAGGQSASFTHLASQNPQDRDYRVPIPGRRGHTVQLVNLTEIADRLHVTTVHAKHELPPRGHHPHQPLAL